MAGLLLKERKACYIDEIGRHYTWFVGNLHSRLVMITCSESIKLLQGVFCRVAVALKLPLSDTQYIDIRMSRYVTCEMKTVEESS